MASEKFEPLKNNPEPGQNQPERQAGPRETEEQRERKRREEDPDWWREQK